MRNGGRFELRRLSRRKIPKQGGRLIVLGINSFFEHPAVALTIDGELVFAIEEERLTRIKHGKKYTPYKTYVPHESIGAALRFANLRSDDVDEIAYSYHPWKHLVATLGCATGTRLSSFREELAAFINLLNVKQALCSTHERPHQYADIAPFNAARTKFRSWDHHLSHAASAFYCSGFDEALVVVADGSGERACTSVYIGRGNKLRALSRTALPHSLGFFYSFITGHLGFEPFSDEYKVMGLAAYGEARYANALSQALRCTPNGRYRVDIRRLQDLEPILGRKRTPNEPVEQRHMDIARSAQSLLEQALQDLVSHHLQRTGLRKLCTAGGVFLNCVANGRLSRLPSLDEYFVQPAAHDAGTAIGAAALSSIRLGGPAQLRYRSMFLGTAYDDDRIVRALDDARVRYMRLSPDTLAPTLARLLANESVVALFRGRMEFGPRALGARSLLASPRCAATREKLNVIKGREQFRPLAPLVREEDYDRCFEGPANRYMMFAVKARPHTVQCAPAVVHADGTARAQIVRSSEDPFLHETLTHFHAATGVPLLINTSLNVRGKPIDESPVDALCSFLTSGADALLIGSYLVER
jgi:carbamoyltransferase